MGHPAEEFYSGIYHASENKKFSEVIVFVHHFGGSPTSSKRHVAFVNELGFDAYTFALKGGRRFPHGIPLNSQGQIGSFHIWCEQIERVLNSFAGKKFLYSFSSPSNACFVALSRRQCRDIAGIVCDGGPFLNFFNAMWNYFTHEAKIGMKIPRAAAAYFSRFAYGSNFEEITDQAIQRIPESFPILSIRNWNDQLVPTRSIDAFFDRNSNLNLEVLSLPEGGHLTGLRDSADVYRPRVEKFLVDQATLL